jgi:hypothetical protein
MTKADKYVEAIKKDLALLKKKKKAILNCLELDLDQFVSIGNDQWCGDGKMVIKVLDKLTKMGEKWIKQIQAFKPRAGRTIEGFIDQITELPYGWSQEAHIIIWEVGFPNFYKV